MSSQSKSSKRKRRSSKLKRSVDGFSKRIGLSPLRLLVALLLLSGVVVLLYFVAFADRDENIDPVDVAESVTEVQERELSVDQLLKKLGTLDAEAYTNSEFLVQIQESEDRLAKLKTLTDRTDLSEQQRSIADRITMQNLALICLESARNGFEFDNFQQKLEAKCSDFIDDPDPELELLANFSLVVTALNLFTEKPTDEHFSQFKRNLVDYKPGYIDNLKNSKAMAAMLVNFTKMNPDNPLRLESLDVFRQQLQSSPQPAITQLAKQLQEEAVFGDFNIGTLKERINNSGFEASKDLDGAIDALAANEDAELETWGTIIKAYESYLALDKIEEAGRAWTKVSEIANRLQDKEKRETILELLKQQRERATKIGDDFDVSGFNEEDGVAIEPSSDLYTVVVFCDKRLESMQMLKDIRVLLQQALKNFRVVLVFEKPLSELDLKTLDLIPKRVRVGTTETSQNYFKQFPAGFFPYIILIDKDGKIACANVGPGQVINRIAALEAQRKRR